MWEPIKSFLVSNNIFELADERFDQEVKSWQKPCVIIKDRPDFWLIVYSAVLKDPALP